MANKRYVYKKHLYCGYQITYGNGVTLYLTLCGDWVDSPDIITEKVSEADCKDCCVHVDENGDFIPTKTNYVEHRARFHNKKWDV
jgi:hypothetical protein